MRMRLIACLLICFACKNKDQSDVEIVKNSFVENEPVTDSLEIYDFEGLQKFLNRQDDTIYIINFWATWCAPCVKELPYFEKLNANYSNENVAVILVSLDFPNSYESKLKPFIKERNLKSKVVALNDVDSNSWIPKIDENWSGAIPATIIYNKNKRQFYERSFDYNELETELKQFLN